MSDYTPDTETVREQYSQEQPPHIGTVAEKRAEFDRWLAQVRAEERERIAQAIEADMNHDLIRNATLATAARIARRKETE